MRHPWINLVQALRPAQWTKNAALLVALVFSRSLGEPVRLALALGAAGVFCLLAGGIYLVNDLRDLEADRRHPVKSRRPLAAGDLDPGLARWAAGGLLALGLGAALWVGWGFTAAALGYVGLQMAYSLRLKQVVIVDLFCIATSFFLRVMAGALAIKVPVSSWLLVCTFFVSLLIALGKRRHELRLLEAGAAEHRAVLGKYDVLLLDQMISVVTAATLVAYTVYTLWPQTVARVGSDNLKYTIPLVLYGLYRYLYLVYRRGEGGAPERLLWTDRPMLVACGLYVALVVGILYGP